ncbi:MAG: hypothetical protein CL819_14985 [Croceicoccus sp.]|nr:hypothetical protein [Croceicoccus sp.]|tara:strand:- start:31088 stop:31582 length:495 start_codon:yes stop_codon:yes gene_type:complete
MGFFDGIDHVWLWLILGAVMLTAELIAPGYFLIWLGLAAFATALVAGVADVDFAIQVLTFAVFSGFSVLAARHWLSLYPIESSDPLMNDRGGRLVGESVVVSRAIEGGSGRVRHGDSEWIARGDDAAVGTRLVVTGHDGAVLLVGPPDTSHIPGSPTNIPPALP